MQGEEAWAEFLRVVRGKSDQGLRQLVPVLGSGVNLQAGIRDSWFDLLTQVARSAGAREVETLLTRGAKGGMTALWEAFLVALSKGPSRHSAPHQVEGTLQQEVARVLRSSHESQAGRLELFDELLSKARFQDVLSLNFDRCALLSAKADTQRIAGPSSLERHGWRGETRIWYPHGDTQKPSTIRLGVRSYGLYVEQLERSLRNYKAGQRRARVSRKARDIARFRANSRLAPPTWLHAALDAPLLFMGCGLSTDEWPLWWFLHQRARNHARLPARLRPATFVLACSRNISEHLLAEPAGVHLLTSPEHPECWRRLFETLSEAREE